LIAYTSAAHALTHVSMLIFSGVLDPMRASFGLSRQDFLAWVSVSTVLFGLGGVPAGWLSDRVGEKRLLVAFFVLTALGCAAIGLATSRIGLGIGFAALGIGASIYHPVGMAFLSKAVSEPGRAMGSNGFWGSAGTALGPLLAVRVAILAEPWGTSAGFEPWRVSYLVLVPVLIVLGVGLALEPFPEATGASSVASGSVRSGSRTRRVDLGSIVFLFLAMMGGGFYFNLITAVLPTLFDERASTASTLGGHIAGGDLAGMVYFVGGFGQILAGRLLSRFEGRGLYVWVLLLSAPLVAAMAAFAGLPLVLWGLVMGGIVFMVQPIENTLLARSSTSATRGILYGLKFVLVFGIGGIGTAVSGRLADAYGTPSVFYAAGFCMLAAAGCAVVAWRRFGRVSRDS
jgi:FSR family fosmidomycin resistance protein-like MFS transporter